MIKKHSDITQHYWSNNGAYENEYSQKYEELVPSSGEAETVHGELIRAISRFYWDYANNGNGNLLQTKEYTCSCCGGDGYEEVQAGYDDEGEEIIETQDCSCCGGTGREDGDIFITEYYQKMFDFMEQFTNDPETKMKLEELQDFLLEGNGDNPNFSDTEMNKYDAVVDGIMYEILTTKNKPNPYFEKRG